MQLSRGQVPSSSASRQSTKRRTQSLGDIRRYVSANDSLSQLSREVLHTLRQKQISTGNICRKLCDFNIYSRCFSNEMELNIPWHKFRALKRSLPFVVLYVFIITMYYLRWLKLRWLVKKRCVLKLMTFLVTISKLRWYHSHLSIKIVAIQLNLLHWHISLICGIGLRTFWNRVMQEGECTCLFVTMLSSVLQHQDSFIALPGTMVPFHQMRFG